MPISGYMYSIIVPNSNRLKSTISSSISHVLLYFLSPLKYSFNDDSVVIYVVIIAHKIIKPKIILKCGLIDLEISANGISYLHKDGFTMKHIIPSASNKQREIET